MKIITKFTVVTLQGMNALSMLTKELAVEKYSALIEQKELNSYIFKNFNELALVSEVNNISSQWLVVYADDKPAGYACITTKGKRPQALEGKRAARIVDFGVLNKYADTGVRDSLLEKCMTVCKQFESIWIIEYAGSPMIEVFESKGFIRQPEAAELEELPLAAVCLIA